MFRGDGSTDIKWLLVILGTPFYMYNFGLIFNRILRETGIKDLPMGTFRHMTALNYL